MQSDIPNTNVESSSLADQVQLKRTRKILLIAVGAFWVLSLFNMISTGLELSREPDSERKIKNLIVEQAVLSVILNTFGLFAIFGYRRTGLLVFAWLNIVELIFISIVIAFILFAFGAVIFVASQRSVDNAYIMAPTIIIVIEAILLFSYFAVKTFIVKYSFKLARIIKANKQFITQKV
ncbi:unnamed protein product [Rotaria magnacalcarata]|uniref:Uncharacterized protein n=2 Tax=Rotaria magnacalcarata TaxID=392030 RepID=A0A816RE00_9BILA|nr:unnamed protein product [Rotaria magnacalcarata]